MTALSSIGLTPQQVQALTRKSEAQAKAPEKRVPNGRRVIVGMPRFLPKYPPEKIEAIKREARSGMKQSDVAAKHGVSQSYVSKLAGDGRYRNRRKCHPDSVISAARSDLLSGMTCREAARKHGISFQYAARIKRGDYRRDAR